MTTPGKYHRVTLISLGAWPPLPPNWLLLLVIFDFIFLSSVFPPFPFTVCEDLHCLIPSPLHTAWISVQVPWDEIALTLQTEMSLLMCDVQREDHSWILGIKTNMFTCCFIQTKCKPKWKSDDSVGAWLACSRSGHFPVQIITDKKGSSALFFCPSPSFFLSILLFFKELISLGSC